MAKVPVVPALGRKDIEKHASENARKVFGRMWTANEPMDLEHLFEVVIPKSLGIETQYADLKSMGINAWGYTCNQAGNKMSLVESSIAYAEDDRTRRFARSTTAHESSHCIMHMKLEDFHQSLLIAGTGMKRERNNLKPYEDPEWQAWYYAGALTMPQDLVMNMVNRYGVGDRLYQEMIPRFDVNYSWAASRVGDLKRFLKF